MTAGDPGDANVTINNADPNRKLGWTQMIRKGKQFLSL